MKKIRLLNLALVSMALPASVAAQNHDEINIPLQVNFPSSTTVYNFPSAVIPGVNGSIPGYAGTPVPIRFKAGPGNSIPPDVHIECQTGIARHGVTAWTNILNWVGSSDLSWGINSLACRVNKGAIMYAIGDPTRGWWPVVGPGVLTGDQGKYSFITALAIRYSPTGRFDAPPVAAAVSASLTVSAGCSWEIGWPFIFKYTCYKKSGGVTLWASSPWSGVPAKDIGKIVSIKSAGNKTCPAGTIDNFGWLPSRCSNSASATCTFSATSVLCLATVSASPDAASEVFASTYALQGSSLTTAAQTSSLTPKARMASRDEEPVLGPSDDNNVEDALLEAAGIRLAKGDPEVVLSSVKRTLNEGEFDESTRSTLLMVRGRLERIVNNDAVAGLDVAIRTALDRQAPFLLRLLGILELHDIGAAEAIATLRELANDDDALVSSAAREVLMGVR